MVSANVTFGDLQGTLCEGPSKLIAPTRPRASRCEHGVYDNRRIETQPTNRKASLPLGVAPPYECFVTSLNTTCRSFIRAAGPLVGGAFLATTKHGPELQSQI